MLAADHQNLVHTLENYIKLAIAALTLAGLIIPSWRKALFGWFRNAARSWQRWKNGELFEKIEEIGCRQIKHTEDIAELRGIVTNGLSHSVLMLLARDRSDFESKEIPAFLCDEMGHNSLVSDGYLKLVGVDRDALKGRGWDAATTGPLKKTYQDTFARCAETGEDFTGSVDFQHPFTTEKRGRWRIHAPCHKIGDHLMFSGKPVLAEDEIAASLVREHNWPIPISPALQPES